MESEAGDLSAHEDIAETQEHDFRLVEQIQAHSVPQPVAARSLLKNSAESLLRSLKMS